MRWIANLCCAGLCGWTFCWMACAAANSQDSTATANTAALSTPLQAVPDSVDKDYSNELPRIPPKSPEEELQSFEVAPGFTVELVAAEPLVADPIAFAFDARGQMFVVEMKDYSEQETECLGSIALLKDLDGDGKMDQRLTFATGLSWPTAIWPWRDGVLVAAPPRITFFRDTDGDGQSDISEVWFEGFQRTNVQGLLNSFRWGVDGYLHGATSSSGAEFVELKLQLRGRDFAIDPLNKSLVPESGGGQHGLNFNRWGDKFVTSNSDHLQQIIDLDQWLGKHPSQVTLPGLRRSIAEDGPQAEVFRASPIEPWRNVRTRLRQSGVAPGLVEGGGRAAGYFTGATATLIMDSQTGWGVDGFDTALVCDVGSNLVHRKQLRPNGLYWTASRIDSQSELLRSSDIWFRPVQLGDGPDGAVYIADMYREVIEHPKSLPPMIKKHLDLTSGRDLGRIWRLKPHDLASRLPPPKKSIADCSNAELVQRLASPIAWQRIAASQALIERRADDVTAELREAAQSRTPEARILALHCLLRLRLLDQATVLKSLTNVEPPVQRHAIAVLRQAGFATSAMTSLEQAASSTDPAIQLQVALTAAELPAQQRMQLLRQLMTAEDPLVRGVVTIAAGNAAHQLLAGTQLTPETLQAWLQIMLPTWSNATGGETQGIGNVLSTGLANAESRGSWLAGLRNLPSAAAAGRLLNLAEPSITYSALAQVERDIQDVLDGVTQHTQSVACLGMLAADRQQEMASDLLRPDRSEAIQLQTIDSLMWSNAESNSELLIARFRSLTPTLQRAALGSFLRYQIALPALARALETRQVLSVQVPPDIRVRLLAAQDKALGRQFATCLQAVDADREAIINQYTSAIDGGQAEAGKLVFNRVCAQCHRLDEIGNDVGPPLKQLADKSPQQLLDAILDPNREVDPKYGSYSVLLKDGRVFTGLIAEESSSQIVLAEAGGKRHTLPRSDIEQLQSSGVSLMPTGLEQQITPEQMSHLLSFLKYAPQKS